MPRKPANKPPRAKREKPEIEIEDIDDAGRNDSSDERRANASGGNSNSSSRNTDGIVLGVGGSVDDDDRLSGTDRETGGVRSAFGIFDDELPIGDFSGPLSGGDDGARERGSGSGRSRRARSATGARSETADKGKASAGDAPPRKVGFGSLGGVKPRGKATAKDVELTSAFFAEGWALVFHGIGVLVNDSEWRLPVEDASELGERTQRWIATLDANRFSRVQKFFGKIQPASSLLFSLAAVVGPRIAHTRSKQHAAHSAKKTNAGPGAAAAPSPASVSPHVVVEENSNGVGGGAVAGNGPEIVVSVPFGRPRWDTADENPEFRQL